MPDSDSAAAGKRTGMLIMFFALGFCSVIVQTTLIRESLVVFSGNELCLGVIFGVWLFWIGVGAAIGSWLSRRMNAFWPFLVAVLIGALCPAAQVYYLRIVRQVFDVVVGAYVPFGQMSLATFVLLAPFSAMIGFTFPLGCKVFVGEESEDALGIGWLYVTEAVGFLTGGLVFTFFLVEHYRAFLNATIVTTLLLAACLTLSTRCLKGLAQLAAPAVIGLILVGVFLAMPRLGELDKLSIQQRWLSIVGTKSGGRITRSSGDAEPRLKLCSHVESKYENLSLGSEPGQYTVYGSGSLMFSFPDDYGFPQQANFILSEHPNPKSLLVIGNAVQGLLKELLRNPLERVWHVDLDPKVTEIIRPVLSAEDAAALKDPRVHFAYTDGRYFVKTTPERFDIVYVNLPSPATAMLNRYYTREFYEEARRILNAGGVMALRIPSAQNYMGPIVGSEGGSIFYTVRSVFPHMTVSGGESASLFASMSDGVVTMAPDVLAQRFNARKVTAPNFSGELFPIVIEQPRVQFAWDAFMALAGVPLNTDLRPITYYYNLRRWDASAGNKLQNTFEIVSRFNIGLLGGVAAALLLLRLGYGFLSTRVQKVCEIVLAGLACAVALAAIRWMLYSAGYSIAAWVASAAVALLCLWWIVTAARRERTETAPAQFNYLTIITVCGFSAMAFELILVFAFQNLYGYLYYQIGLIIALFMIGLAIGGLVCNLLLRAGRVGLKALMGIEVAVAAYAFLLPVGLKAFSSEIMAGMPLGISQCIFMSFILVAGVLGGFVFPLVTGLYFKIVLSTGATAGKVDSADHVGACLGSLLAGTVFVPIIGIAASSVLVGILNLGCLCLLAVQMLRGKAAGAAS